MQKFTIVDSKISIFLKKNLKIKKQNLKVQLLK
jgi:hypothetical protein